MLARVLAGEGDDGVDVDGHVNLCVCVGEKGSWAALKTAKAAHGGEPVRGVVG
jgi:hypothetical protein